MELRWLNYIFLGVTWITIYLRKQVINHECIGPNFPSNTCNCLHVSENKSVLVGLLNNWLIFMWPVCVFDIIQSTRNPSGLIEDIISFLIFLQSKKEISGREPHSRKCSLLHPTLPISVSLLFLAYFPDILSLTDM